MRKGMRKGLSLALIATLTLAGAALLTRGHAADSAKKPYVVINGKVNHPVFEGYLRYGENCLRCHGPDGLGSSYAPSLVTALKSLSYLQFARTVINGKQNVGNGMELVMPAFGLNPDVVNYLNDIYAYLKARSDGAIGRGRPHQIPQ